eukprot:4306648-Karenia_brevis.AAC.1
MMMMLMMMMVMRMVLMRCCGCRLSTSTWEGFAEEAVLARYRANAAALLSVHPRVNREPGSSSGSTP